MVCGRTGGFSQHAQTVCKVITGTAIVPEDFTCCLHHTYFSIPDSLVLKPNILINDIVVPNNS